MNPLPKSHKSSVNPLSHESPQILSQSLTNYKSSSKVSYPCKASPSLMIHESSPKVSQILVNKLANPHESSPKASQILVNPCESSPKVLNPCKFSQISKILVNSLPKSPQISKSYPQTNEYPCK